jgi:colicin import membrane protein
MSDPDPDQSAQSAGGDDPPPLGAATASVRWSAIARDFVAAKPAETKPNAKPAETTAKPTEKPSTEKPPDKTASAKPAGAPGGTGTGQAAADGPPSDAYGAAANRWREKAGGGGGLNGPEGQKGPIGEGGDGGGGGQLVGIEFLAYRQRVITVVKEQWANAVRKAGLVAKVQFQISPEGEISNIRVAHPSGDPTYDTSVMRAVQRANPLPPPPAQYRNQFRDFLIEFHSEEGGQGAG